MVNFLTTTEAARILGLHPAYVRTITKQGKIPAQRIDGQWQLALNDVVAYRRQLKPTLRSRTSNRLLAPSAVRSLQLLQEWGSAEAEQLALVIEVHPGNIRKGLAIAEKLGFAARTGTDWSLTEDGRRWLAEHPQEVAA